MNPMVSRRRLLAAGGLTLPAGLAATVAAPAASADATRPVVAQEVLSAAPVPADVYRLAAERPTVTLSESGAASSIADAVVHRPRRVAPGDVVVDVESDPYFRYHGVPAGKLVYGRTSPDTSYVRPGWLTGGSAQSARWRPAVSFVHSGAVAEVALKATTAAFHFRLAVDGLRVTEESVTISQTPSGAAIRPGSLYLLRIAFPGGAHRELRLEVSDPSFGGVWVAPSATLTRGPAPARGVFAVLGDSITGGATGIGPQDTYVSRLGDLLGFDTSVNLGIGGTGYFTGAPGSTFGDRVADVVAARPQVLLVFGSYSDATYRTGAEIQAECLRVLREIQQELPSTLVVTAGCWAPGTPTAPSLQAANEAVKAAAAAAGTPFVDLHDPLGLRADASLAWRAGVTYAAGDVCVRGGAVHSCIASHTAAATFDPKKWRGTSWVNGTGRQGSPAGDGNADLAVLSDRHHPTAFGHQLLERLFADACLTAVASYV